MANKNFLITGPNGVGKSTLIAELMAQHPGRVRRLSSSRILMACLGVGSYEELAAFPDEVKHAAFDGYASRLMADNRAADDGVHYLIDTHLLYFKSGEVVSSYMPYVAEADGIVAVHARGEQVLDRMHQDAASGTRERSMLPPGLEDRRLAAALIAGYMAMNSAFAQSLGETHDIPVLLVDNSDTPRDAARQFIASFLPELLESADQ